MTPPETEEEYLSLDGLRLLSALHNRLPRILDRIGVENASVTLTCDDCDWIETYNTDNHESTSMMAARMDAAIVTHANTNEEHMSYSVGIDATAQTNVIDTSITIFPKQ